MVPVNVTFANQKLEIEHQKGPLNCRSRRYEITLFTMKPTMASEAMTAIMKAILINLVCVVKLSALEVSMTRRA